jgi:YbgC/YbaW family acyl-CoA thioester hydrolase
MQETVFKFSHPITVAIKDINYGGHVGNDVYLSYFQDARIAYLKHLGFSEMNIGGCGMIMAKAEVEYKAELFHSDEILVFCKVSEIKNSSFIMEYQISKKDNTLAGLGKTVMVAFDYQNRKIVRVSEEFRAKVAAMQKQ